jgi:hypothetical protein
MTPYHPLWEDFITRLAGEEGIHTRLKGDVLDWDCDHSQRMVFSRYLLAEIAGVDVEATIKWFINQAWICDCGVVFFSDGTDIEKRIFLEKR